MGSLQATQEEHLCDRGGRFQPRPGDAPLSLWGPPPKNRGFLLPGLLGNPFFRAHANGVVLSQKGVLLPSRCLLESPFLEPLLRTLLRTLLPIQTHCKTPSKNPSYNLLESNLENPSKHSSEKGALLHAPVGVRPMNLGGHVASRWDQIS